MTKTQLNNMAKERLVDALSIAYYSLEDVEGYDDLTEDEKRYVLSRLDKYGETMCKAIGKRYYTM